MEVPNVINSYNIIHNKVPIVKLISKEARGYIRRR